ncbi:MAG: 50S ribosomal protein L24e [Candidatus Diapherotrites archaeon CG08_land_8_20_14_0_20_30_16]|nr:MAG: 50S ribosomal protein L24e [Candidatus Diapherotrites archaeon CG08_land_8_20_14_0_20_30_16]
MKCNFCNKDIKEGTGILYVKRDGTAYNFCSGKCQLNMLKLRRKSSNMKWVTKSKAHKDLQSSSSKKKKQEAKV